MQTKLSILGLYNYRPDIFDNMTVPAGVVKSRVIDTILMECAELGLTYSEPDTVKLMITIWSANKLPAWERIWTALEESYDPLHNYDKHESWDDTSSASASGSNQNKVAGFNQSAGLTDRDSSTQSTSSSASGNRTGHVYGNIGVTTSAQMLQGEIDVRLANDMYNIICQSFKTQFCIQIY